MNEDRFVVQNDERNENEIFMDENQYGPLELNLLERIEQGLNYSDQQSFSKNESLNNDNEKYTGPKEIIFVSGWVNIKSIYNKYLAIFFSRIFIGMMLLFTFLFWQKNFIYVALALSIVTLSYTLYYVYQLFMNQNSNLKIRIMYWIEFSLMLGLFIYFFGFILIIGKMIPLFYLPFFIIPYLATTIFIMFYNPEDKHWISQKKFCFFEAIQLLLISLKLSLSSFISWNYVLIVFMGVSVYLLVLGLLMSIILSCSLFGFLYRDIESWKVKSLIWMTWYYLWTGMVFVYLVKGTIMYFEDDFIDKGIYTNPGFFMVKSDRMYLIEVAAILMIICSIISLVFHIMWEKEIKRYLTKVIYRNELRKEISLRFLSKSFTFNLIQVSSTYFMKSDRVLQTKNKPVIGKNQHDQENQNQSKNQDNNLNTSKIQDNKKIPKIQQSLIVKDDLENASKIDQENDSKIDQENASKIVYLKSQSEIDVNNNKSVNEKDQNINKSEKDNDVQEIEIKAQDKNSKKSISINKKDNSFLRKELVSETNYEDELCVFCYENPPNILIDPCCHGGICKECMINYLKNQEGRCPFGKEVIKRLFLLEYDQDKKQLYAKGEINLCK